MTNIKVRFVRRLSALLLITLIAAFALVSLSSCSGKTVGKISEMGERETETEFVARVISTNPDLKVRFIAASRGHDMAAEGFDDAAIENNTYAGYPNVGLCRSILKDIVADASFKSSDSRVFVNDFAEDMEAEEILAIVAELGVEYELDVNHGVLEYILIGIGKVLGWMTNLFGGQYVVAILVFALLVEIVMLPVSIKQQKNSVGMAKLRPKLAKIEKKYAGRNDQVTLRKKQEEIMELQRAEGYSPFSGCLPLLLQLVIVGFILYPIIQNPLRYMLDTSQGFSEALIAYATSPRAIGGLGLSLSSKNSNVIEILSMLNAENIVGIKTFPLIANGNDCYATFTSLNIPTFTIGNINLGRVPKVLDVLVIIPILNVAVQWVSMKLTRKWTGNNMAPAGGADAQTNASLKMMDIMMPLMTLFIMFQVPVLLGVYWLFRSAISLVKQYFMKMAFPVPKYTEDELREIEKAERAKQKAENEIIKSKPKYRSLHYIDEDDYDELPEIKGSNQKPSKTLGSEKPEIKD